MLLLAGCAGPIKSPPSSQFPAMAPDGSHVIIGFTDALSDKFGRENVEVTASDGTRLTIDSVFLDSVSGAMLEIEVSPSYDLRTPLHVKVFGLCFLRGPAVSEQPIEVTIAPGVLYSRDIAPLLAARCSGCHGASNPGGGYRTDSRAALYAFGSDSLDLNRSPDLIPGNDRCQLAVKTSYTGREFYRANLEFFEAELIRQWILNGDAADVHPAGLPRSITAQVRNFTLVNVVFPAQPDLSEALQPSNYRLVDLDVSGPPFTPAGVEAESRGGTIVTLRFPQQKMYHHYQLTVGAMHDQYGMLMFDSATAGYRALLSYAVDIAPLFARTCNNCHGPSATDSLCGGYRTDSYGALFGYGSDSTLDTRHRNLEPADSICAIVTKTRQIEGKTGKCALRVPLSPMESHQITDWVINYYAREN